MNSIDIARIAGVSRSTVSRVINNYPNVPPETRKRILSIIKENNYVPHASARMLAGKSNKILGVFIIDIRKDLYDYRISQSSYFTPFLSAIIDTVSEYGYNVLVSTINKNKDYVGAQRLFINKTICGGIFIGGKNNEPELGKLIELGYKLAIIDQEIHSWDNIYNNSIIVNVDNFKGGYEATKYLINKGHTAIAHICGDKNKLSGIQRLEGYKQALKDSGIALKNNLIVNGEFTEESGYNAAKKLLLKDVPSGIFAGNDSMAVGAIKYLEETKLSIPKDISIIGFDDIEIARYLSPALTTVKMATLEMAAFATKNLVNLIEKSIKHTVNYVARPEIVERESCRQL